MSSLLPVRGTDLRYLLTTYLFDHGTATVDELVDSMTYQGFDIGGRPSKSVSDALRWEVQRGRVVRCNRAQYCAGFMPRATQYRIDQRVVALRVKVAALSRIGGQTPDTSTERRV
jgi:hypothetical protein